MARLRQKALQRQRDRKNTLNTGLVWQHASLSLQLIISKSGSVVSKLRLPVQSMSTKPSGWSLAENPVGPCRCSTAGYQILPQSILHILHSWLEIRAPFNTISLDDVGLDHPWFHDGRRFREYTARSYWCQKDTNSDRACTQK